MFIGDIAWPAFGCVCGPHSQAGLLASTRWPDGETDAALAEASVKVRALVIWSS